MPTLDLSKYGIKGVKEVLYNPSYEVLFNEETRPELTGYEKGQETELGAINVMTGIYTGRSPKDKYIVMDNNLLFFAFICCIFIRLTAAKLQYILQITK